MNILYLCAFVPFPVTDGDHVRAEFTLRALAKRHRVFGFFLDPAGVGVPLELKKICTKVERVPLPASCILKGAVRSLLLGKSLHAYAYFHSFARARLKAAIRRWPVKAVHVHRIRMMPYAEGLGLPYVLDATDCLGHYFKTARDLDGLRRRYALLDGGAVAKAEAEWAGKAVATLVTTSIEKAHMRREGVPPSGVHVVPNGIDLRYWAPSMHRVAGRELVFLGNLGYPPNEKGLAWFFRSVAPRIARNRPGLEVNVIGGGAGRTLINAANDCRMRVAFHGFMADPRPVLRRAMAVICPLPLAAGIQNKAVQSLACGAPLVVTGNVARALGASPGKDLLTADEAGEFARQVIRLADDPVLARRIAAAGRRLAERKFGFRPAAARLNSAWNRRTP